MDAIFRRDAAVEDVLRALRRLASDDGPLVTEPYLVAPRAGPRFEGPPTDALPTEAEYLRRFRPVRGGPLCEHLFGFAGDTRRLSRWGHVRVPGGVVLPALEAPLAELLGLGVADLRRVARAEAGLDRLGQLVELGQDGGEQEGLQVGPGAILAALGRSDRPSPVRSLLDRVGLAVQALVPEVLPLPPPGRWPLGRDRDGSAVGGALHLLVPPLLRRVHLLGMLNQPGVSHDLLRECLAPLHDALAAVGESLARQPVDPWQPPEPWFRPTRPQAQPDRPVALTLETSLGPRLRGCALAGPQTALVQLAEHLVAIDLQTGQCRPFHAPSCQVAWVDGAGQRVVVEGIQSFIEPHQTWEQTAFFLLDLERGEWGGALPEGMPQVWFTEAEERSYLEDARTGRRLRLWDVAGAPERVAFSPDRQLLWAEDAAGAGGLFRPESGVLWWMLPVEERRGGPVPRLGPDGRRGEWTGPSEEGRSRPWTRAAAVVRRGDGAVLTYDEGLLCQDGKLRYSLGPPSVAAAFSKPGDRLLLVFEQQACLYDLPSDLRDVQLVHRFSLKDLDDERLPGLLVRLG
jgi:hypothetical protein